jgi:LacI family transcriptional regulator
MARRKPDPTDSGTRPTLKRLALAVGVHASTVSRALDPQRSTVVAPAVVARVRAAAERMGYRPDPVARSLRTRRSHLIGVLVPDIANPVFSPIIGGIAEALAQADYALVVADGGTDGTRQSDMAERLIAQRIDGLILATASRRDGLVERCRARGLPVVLVNRASDDAGLAAIVSDDAAGMALVVAHLASLGHRRIGHLAGPAAISTGFLRRSGFEAALQAHGLDDDPRRIEAASAYTRAAGAAAAEALLARCPEITALAAANDLLALGALEALRKHGLACPRDISVTGHNDMPHVDLVDPPLTTVRIEHREMGQRAARAVLAAIDAKDAPAPTAQTVRLAPTLIVRASSGRPRDANG